jgi:hypothetical protein
MVSAPMALGDYSAGCPACLMGIHLGPGGTDDDEGRGNCYRHRTDDLICAENMHLRPGGQDGEDHHGSWHIR